MRRVLRRGLGAEIPRAFTEAAFRKSRRPIGMRESRTGRAAAFRCQKAKSCAIVSHGETSEHNCGGRATGFGGIRGDAAACPSRFCDRKLLIRACCLAADRFVDLLSDRCHGRYVSSRYGIKSVTACVADVVCRVLCCLIKRMACCLQDISAAAQGGRGKLRASGGHEGLITNR